MPHQWICMCIYYLLILFPVYYTTMSSWCSRVFGLAYFYLLVCLITVSPKYVWSACHVREALFCLSYFNFKPYQSVAYSPWSGPNFTSYRAWAAFHGHICWCIVSCHAVWLVITCNRPATDLLALLNEANKVSFPLVTHCCFLMIHMCPWIC